MRHGHDLQCHGPRARCAGSTPPTERRSAVDRNLRTGDEIGCGRRQEQSQALDGIGLCNSEDVLPAGSVQTQASFIFAMYAAARTLPLALMALAAIYLRSASSLKVLGLLAGFIQFADGAVGLYQHDIGKTIEPLALGALQIYAVSIRRKDL